MLEPARGLGEPFGLDQRLCLPQLPGHHVVRRRAIGSSQRAQRRSHPMPVATQPGEIGGRHTGVADAHRQRGSRGTVTRRPDVLGRLFPRPATGVEVTGHPVHERQLPGLLRVVGE